MANKRGRHVFKVGVRSSCPTVSVEVAIFVNLIFLIYAHSSVHDLLDTPFDFFNEVLFYKAGSVVDVRYDIFVTIFLVNLAHHSHLRRIALKQSSLLSCGHFVERADRALVETHRSEHKSYVKADVEVVRLRVL
jgi:hypothetical protein